jgi:GNAT superfamily N-acetyltransferase
VGTFVDVGGLRIGTAGAALDVLRHRDPSDAEIPGLLAAGFLIRPYEVAWIAPTGATAEEFLSRLSGKDRQNIRAARRSLAADLAIEALDEPLLDDFLVLYTRALANMPNGIPVAVKQRALVLKAADSSFVVTARSAGTLVAACLVVLGAGLARIRFSAADEHLRGASITRVLYLAAVDEARRRGIEQVSLGSDLNLYGHIVQPGLFSFKARLGFSAYPAQTVLGDGHDLAERLLNLDRLSDPTLTLAYASVAGGVDRSAPLHLHLFTRDAAPDVRPYRAPFVGGVHVHRGTDRSGSNLPPR